jgi:prophage maintenance system killer protein
LNIIPVIFPEGLNFSATFRSEAEEKFKVIFWAFLLLSECDISRTRIKARKPKNLNMNTHLYTPKMKFTLTKKDIVALNQEFDEGNLHNEASLDFALGYARKTENWTKALAWLVRAILLDHVFEEGNKRTAALLIKAYSEYEGHRTYNDRLVKLITEIILKKVTTIWKIEEMIKDAIK